MIQAKDKFMQLAIDDNGKSGFRDDKFDSIFEGRDKLNDYLVEMDRDTCLELFDEYVNMQHKIN